MIFVSKRGSLKMIMRMNGVINRFGLLRKNVWIYVLAIGMSLANMPFLGSPIDSSDHLDSSWATYMYTVISRHLTFGTRYIWTYGPFGFLDIPLEYSRSLLTLVIVIQIYFSLLFAIIFAYMLEKINIKEKISILLVMLLPLGPVSNLEYRSTLIAVMLMIIASEGHTTLKKRYWIEIMAGGLLAFAALVKSSMMVTGMPISILYLIFNFRREKLGAFLVPLSFFLGWIGGFLIFGQSLSSAFQTPLLQIQLITGYVSMAIHGSYIYLVLLAITLIFGFLLLDMRLVKSNFWVVVASAFLVFEAYKEGFTRQDGHVYTYFSVIPWVAFLLWYVVRSGQRWSKRVDVGFVGVISLSFCILTLNIGTVVQSLAHNIAATPQVVKYITNKSFAKSINSAERSGIVSSRPGLQQISPFLEGKSAFSWPWDINALMGVNARIEQPPVPQEYSAYTPKLDHLDSNYFTRGSAPSFGLITTGAIDGRLPLQTAPLTLRTMMERYSPLAVSGSYLLVRKNSHPGTWVSDSSALMRAVLGETVNVPAGNFVVAKIDVHPSVFGGLMALFFRQTPLYILEHLSTGSIQKYRLVQKTIKDGILISSSPQSVQGLSLVWSGVPADRVNSFQIVTPHQSQWESKYSIQFQEFSFKNHGEVVYASPASDMRHLIEGHIDSVSKIAGTNYDMIQGWCYIPGLKPSSLRLGVPGRGGRVLMEHSVQYPRPDVVKALGSQVTLFTGFRVTIPIRNWTGNIAIMLKESGGGYKLLGKIKG